MPPEARGGGGHEGIERAGAVRCPGTLRSELPLAQFPRRPLLGSSVDKGKKKDRA